MTREMKDEKDKCIARVYTLYYCNRSFGRAGFGPISDKLDPVARRAYIQDLMGTTDSREGH
jgi:hypothetical protein